MEDVEADPQLRGIVAVDHDVRHLPFLRPYRLVFVEQLVEPSRRRLTDGGLRRPGQLGRLDIQRGYIRNELLDDDRASLDGIDGILFANVTVSTLDLGAGGLAVDADGHRRTDLMRVDAGFVVYRGLLDANVQEGKPSVVTVGNHHVLRAHFLPKLLAVVRVLVVDVAVEVRRDRQLARIVERRDLIADRGQTSVGGADETNGLDSDLLSRRQLSRKTTCESGFHHIEHTPEIGNLRLRQIEGLAVDVHVDAGPVDRVDHLAEVLGVPVLPPPHPRLVRVEDA